MGTEREVEVGGRFRRTFVDREGGGRFSEGGRA